MWLYENKEVDKTQLMVYIGYVYKITNLTNGKMYIGKKLLKFKRTKMVKGKKKKYVVDSDWETYYGSNLELQQDVQALGTNKFKREILALCKTKGECSYIEALYQFQERVLERDDYYNAWISCRIRRSHLKKGKEHGSSKEERPTEDRLVKAESSGSQS